MTMEQQDKTWKPDDVTSPMIDEWNGAIDEGGYGDMQLPDEVAAVAVAAAFNIAARHYAPQIKALTAERDRLTARVAELEGVARLAGGDPACPHRALRMVMVIDADDRERMLELLADYAARVADGETQSVHGGCSAGAYFFVEHDPEQTSERFHEQLRAYLDPQDAAALAAKGGA